MPHPIQSLRTVAAILALAALGTALTGCGGSPEPGDFDDYRDEILDRYFVTEAAEALKTVPLNQGTVNVAGGFSVGPDIGSRLASWVFGNGWQTQVLVAYEPSEFLVFHEYIHQADYMRLLDRAEFRTQYARLKEDRPFDLITAGIEEQIVSFFSGDFLSRLALAYNDGLTRELMAALIEGHVRGDYELPAYFLDVYRDVVRLED